MEGVKNWQKEVSIYLSNLNDELLKNKESIELYNGFYVWDSKIIIKPKIMFIGINPGNGDPNNNVNRIVTDGCEQMSYMEYLDGENPSYTLARETIETLSKVKSIHNVREFLNNETVKTNFHFIITSVSKNISKCLDKIGKYEEFNRKSSAFIEKLIKIIQPKIVICEGKYTFNRVQEFYEPEEISIHWKDDVGVIKVKNADLVYLGYSRLPFKNKSIKNIDGLAKVIEKYL